MCKSVLYAVNSAPQDVVVNGLINFGSVIHQTGNKARLVGGNPVIRSAGNYDVEANVVFVASAGTTTITLYEDGVAIPGAQVSLTTVAGNVYSVTFGGIIHQFCCNPTTITAVLSGAEANLTNVSIKVVEA